MRRRRGGVPFGRRDFCGDDTVGAYVLLASHDVHVSADLYLDAVAPL
jgi:hypothetical protein